MTWTREDWCILGLLVIASAVALCGQTPHDVQSCDLPSRAERTGAHKCTCVGMVADVQSYYRERCWAAAGLPVPPPDWRAQLLAPELVKRCLGESVPDHCGVIAHGWNYWQRHADIGEKWKHPTASEAYNRCSTSCKPERCKCPDTVCPSHEQRNYYGESH